MSQASGRVSQIHDEVGAVLAKHEGRWSPQVVAMALVPGPCRSESEWVDLLDECERVIVPLLPSMRGRAKSL